VFGMIHWAAIYYLKHSNDAFRYILLYILFILIYISTNFKFYTFVRMRDKSVCVCMFLYIYIFLKCNLTYSYLLYCKLYNAHVLIWFFFFWKKWFCQLNRKLTRESQSFQLMRFRSSGPLYLLIRYNNEDINSVILLRFLSRVWFCEKK